MSGDISIKRILVPLDGSDSSFQAAKYAVKLAKMVNAEIIFVHAVVNPPYVEYKTAGLVIMHYIEEAKKHAEMWFTNAGDIASKERVKFSSETVLDVASVADTIVTYADSKKADLIVMGTKGRTGVKRFLLGSVASGVVAHAKCSVLVVR
ncbi:MAG TPA: universal stress protein [Nitrososphaera sp.]|nr:universal stress protein [Nitrososphaera sp.]